MLPQAVAVAQIIKPVQVALEEHQLLDLAAAALVLLMLLQVLVEIAQVLLAELVLTVVMLVAVVGLE
jgi:hypothetical protein